MAKGTHIYSRCLSALGRKLRFKLFFPKKVAPLQKQAKDHSRGSAEFLNQNMKQIGPGFMSYDRTYKLTGRDHNFMYRDLNIDKWFYNSFMYS